jgi:hypothetical protein
MWAKSLLKIRKASYLPTMVINTDFMKFHWINMARRTHATNKPDASGSRMIEYYLYKLNFTLCLLENTLMTKFGIHIMRGIPRKAVALNLPIYGTEYSAAAIANTYDTCKWCDYNYGVNMDHPGAQPFYNSWINQLAYWGVDFIKADDITGFLREIEALVKAIEQCGRDIVLSLSPGGQTTLERMPAYTLTNMLRTTKDIWDNRGDLDKAFDAWEKYNDIRIPGFWLDKIAAFVPFRAIKS